MKFRQNGANGANAARRCDAPLCRSAALGTPVAYNAYKEKEKKKGAAPDKAPPLSLRFSLAPLRRAFPKQDVPRRGVRKVSAPAFPAHAEKRAEKKAAAFSLPREKNPPPLSRSLPRGQPLLIALPSAAASASGGRFFLRGRRSPLCKTGAKKQPARGGRLFCFVYFSSRCLSPLAAMSRRYCMPRQEMHDTPA